MVKLIKKAGCKPLVACMFYQSHFSFMYNFFRALAVFMLLPAFAFAQFSLSGSVTDAATNQPLPGASVQLSAKNGQMTDDAGNFKFTDLEAGNYSVRVTYLGFEPVSQTVELNADKTLSFSLKKSSIRTGEVVITATRATDKTGDPTRQMLRGGDSEHTK